MAAHLGKTVKELTEQLSHDELIEWMAFDELDPIGGYRGDLNAAIIAQSQNGGPLKDYIIIDPFPMTDEQREQYELEQQRIKLEQSTQRMAAMFTKDAI